MKRSAKHKSARPKHHRGYLAEVQASTRDSTRVVRSRWLRVTADDPAGLIKAAARLKPKSRAYHVQLFKTRGDDNTRTDLSLYYGRDKSGVSWYVNVDLDDVACRVMAAHMSAQMKVETLWMVVPFDAVAHDDDGGEKLSVPTISASAAAHLTVRH